jgi:hypothetical protein
LFFDSFKLERESLVNVAGYHQGTERVDKLILFDERKQLSLNGYI